MFIEVEKEIRDTLKKAFENYTEIKDNIELAIGKENVLIETPLKLPAVRVIFLGSDFNEEIDLGSSIFKSQLKYGVLLFFRSFKDRTAKNIYKYLEIIYNTLKDYRTKKGVLKPVKMGLEVSERGNYYIYSTLFKLETVA